MPRDTSPWKTLERDPRFILRRTKTIETLADEALRHIREAKLRFQTHQDSVKVICEIRNVQMDMLKKHCEEVYAIAKLVWKSRGETVSSEFCRSLFQDMVLSEIERYSRIHQGYLRQLRFQLPEVPETVRNAIDKESRRLLEKIRGRLKLIVEIEAADLEPEKTPIPPLPNPRGRSQFAKMQERNEILKKHCIKSLADIWNKSKFGPVLLDFKELSIPYPAKQNSKKPSKTWDDWSKLRHDEIVRVGSVLIRGLYPKVSKPRRNLS